MIINQLTLTNFRCFKEKKVTFDGRIVVVEGANGSGKSSLLEALHYCCYLRSFRTHLNRELVHLDHDHFFAHVDFEQEQLGTKDTIHVGYSEGEGKVVKCNQKTVQSYKELIDAYRIVTLSADDVALIQGAPEHRRNFLNYALMLHQPDLLALFKRYRTILDHRNSLLALPPTRGNDEELAIWSAKLWHEAAVIRQERIAYLTSLEAQINQLLATYFHDEAAALSVSLTYNARNITAAAKDFETFWPAYSVKHCQFEREVRRSMFGAHLDDFGITFQDKRARVYASRGQQKLLVLLIKIAQLQQLSQRGESGVLLLDDFMTDFDHRRVEQGIEALKSLRFQMFLSCPIDARVVLRNLSSQDICRIQVP